MTEIKINDKFSLPIFAQAIWNPCVEDAFLVFGVTLRHRYKLMNFYYAETRGDRDDYYGLK